MISRGTAENFHAPSLSNFCDFFTRVLKPAAAFDDHFGKFASIFPIHSSRYISYFLESTKAALKPRKCIAKIARQDMKSLKLFCYLWERKRPQMVGHAIPCHPRICVGGVLHLHHLLNSTDTDAKQMELWLEQNGQQVSFSTDGIQSINFTSLYQRVGLPAQITDSDSPRQCNDRCDCRYACARDCNDNRCPVRNVAPFSG